MQETLLVSSFDFGEAFEMSYSFNVAIYDIYVSEMVIIDF